MRDHREPISQLEQVVDNVLVVCKAVHTFTGQPLIRLELQHGVLSSRSKQSCNLVGTALRDQMRASIYAADSPACEHRAARSIIIMNSVQNKYEVVHSEIEKAVARLEACFYSSALCS
mmetsp:Transcript_20814/g.70873  ORF Transcript_20814/g.70873 Transcript_20814/m.70873 type:complete len:118 (-) Transcript_20814:236-589(-)